MRGSAWLVVPAAVAVAAAVVAALLALGSHDPAPPQVRAKPVAERAAAVDVRPGELQLRVKPCPEGSRPVLHPRAAVSSARPRLGLAAASVGIHVVVTVPIRPWVDPAA